MIKRDESDGGAGFEATSMNSLASAFGVSFAATETEPDGYEILAFNSHPVTAGLGPLPGSGMCVDFQRTLTVVGPALDLTVLGAPLSAASNRIGSPSYPNVGCTPMNTLPSCIPNTRISRPFELIVPGARPHSRSMSSTYGQSLRYSSTLIRYATLASVPDSPEFPSSSISRN